MSLRGQLYNVTMAYRRWGASALGEDLREFGNQTQFVYAPGEASRTEIIGRGVDTANQVLDSSVQYGANSLTVGCNTMDEELRRLFLQAKELTSTQQAADPVTSEAVATGNMGNVAKFPIANGTFGFKGVDITASATISAGFTVGKKVYRQSDSSFVGVVAVAASGTAVTLAPLVQMPLDTWVLVDEDSETLTVTGAPAANDAALTVNTHYTLNLTHGFYRVINATQIPPGHSYLTKYTPAARILTDLEPGSETDTKLYLLGKAVNKFSLQQFHFVFPQVTLAPTSQSNWAGDEPMEFVFEGSIESPPAGYANVWREIKEAA